ncbi:mannose-6-phosphate isomerase, class I [Vibrio fluvialis]|uniref:mannose-6-phosphate isomerase, class I n=1 Tax=Vibrio fluvialis TaxID=676 RepID=UPI001ABEC6DF|nr:mannose-6-phosphate isomerase, class I [Vibrio fluvialis]MBY7838693.1 mannose-6-phosphate isomerase, class I [Vibrio fluvialis]MBY7995142.1 mannose-6-phosphate isomerase, class I [Vibrio fluvialis]QTH08187.1 mannose-6-phosphate isomerase, class I [Vibrio fluvialis]
MNSNTISSKCFFKMDNKIQNYDWGSRTAIHDLFGFANEAQQPQAEVWMGTHPNGCSIVKQGSTNVSLSELIEQDPPAFLSQSTSKAFGDLPFLFKILAADKALSIQVHPNKQDAELGYAKEQELGVPLSAFNRNYKDANHKPELVYALTEYQAMNGFRPFDEIITEFRLCDIPEVNGYLDQFERNPNQDGLCHFFVEILSMKEARKLNAVDHLLSYAAMNQARPVYALILDLAEQYPNDVGLFAPLLLNVITLKPGEAMFLCARTPHAYIKGTGLEIMANSDNVLRAGLTPKHMDVEELVKCTDFIPKPINTLLTQAEINGSEHHFPVSVQDFKFSIFQAPKEQRVEMTSAEILMPIDADVALLAQSGETLVLGKGQSAFIPAYVGNYTISCEGRVARAFNG